MKTLGRIDPFFPIL